MTQRTALLFLTHLWNPVLALRFRRLLEETRGLADCYILLQTRRNDAAHMAIDAGRGALRVFDAEALPGQLGYPFLSEGQLIPGSAHFPLLWFARSQAYADYWVVEYDVEYTGHWGGFLGSCAAQSADLLAAHLLTRSESPDWGWWQSLHWPDPPPEGRRGAPPEPVKMFMPIYRISRRALAWIDRAHLAGWRGHVEALVPTLLTHHGFEIRNFVDIGAFYQGTGQVPGENGRLLSTLRYRPVVERVEMVESYWPDTLYHPVKDDWVVEGGMLATPLEPRSRRALRAVADRGYPVRLAGHVADLQDGRFRLRTRSRAEGSWLNASAAQVWFACDGQSDVVALIASLRDCHPEQGEDLVADACQALLDLEQAGLIEFAREVRVPRPLVTVGFRGFGPEFAADDNFLLWMLTHEFDAVLVGAEPAVDFLFYRSPSREPFDLGRFDRSRTFLIQVRADDGLPDFQNCDYVLSSRAVTGDQAGRHGQLPAWACYLDWDAYARTSRVFSDACLPEAFRPEQLCARLRAALDDMAALDLPEPAGPPLPTTGSPGPAIAGPTARPVARKLTIGMATYDDFDGVYFTVQGVRINHPEILDETEFLILDNHPEGGGATALQRFAESIPACRYLGMTESRGTAARDRIFREAETEHVLCVDSHIFLAPGSLRRLIDYLEARPDCQDLLQGPLVYDDLQHLSTHFNPVWSGGMYGQWGTDARGLDPDGEPFEIPMQGLGVFACRKSAWLGFNPRFSGFGGEEGYIHEKFRQAGRRTLCLPFLRWVHRFHRPFGTVYRNAWIDRIRNYIIGFGELGLDTDPIDGHFRALLGEGAYDNIRHQVVEELDNPFHFFDAIYCINLDAATDRWQAMQARFRRLGIEARVRRFSAVATPDSHHVGCALSHRAILEKARRQGYRSVLVFEDDAVFHDETLVHLARSLAELRGEAWKLLYLGGHRWGRRFSPLAGCHCLDAVDATLTCTHALAYHESVYAELLDELPGDPAAMKAWLAVHHGIDQYLCRIGGRVLTSPVLATQPGLLRQEDSAQRARFRL